MDQNWRSVATFPQVSTRRFCRFPWHAPFYSSKGCAEAVQSRARAPEWFNQRFLPLFRPVTILALLATLVLIFAFQAENILRNWAAVLLLAVPILIQVYFNSSLVYGTMRIFKVEHNIATPGALIGASNFFELAVAVAMTLFGPASPAALATVVGVLVEVPVMLSVCRFCVSSREWYERQQIGSSKREFSEA